jgi:hypothetical protein
MRAKNENARLLSQRSNPMNPSSGFVHDALSCGVSRKDITAEWAKGGWT